MIEISGIFRPLIQGNFLLSGLARGVSNIFRKRIFNSNKFFVAYSSRRKNILMPEKNSRNGDKVRSL
jgi:hypothetical protein